MPVGGSTAGSGLSITQDSLLDFKNSTLSGVAAIISTNGTWSITADGILTAGRVEAKTVQTEDVVVVQSEQQSAASEGKIPAGSSATVIQNPAMKANSKVFVSFLGDPGSSWWIGEKGDGNFTLHVKLPVADDAPFEYWIVGVDDRRPPPAQDDGSSTSTPSVATDSASGTSDATGSGTDTPPAPTTDSASGTSDSGSSTPATPADGA
jgi:hypothetical protein